MARTRAFIRPQIDHSIATKLREKLHEERFHGGMAAFIEGILDRYCDGILVDVTEPSIDEIVKAVRVKQAGGHERRKAS